MTPPETNSLQYVEILTSGTFASDLIWKQTKKKVIAYLSRLDEVIVDEGGYLLQYEVENLSSIYK